MTNPANDAVECLNFNDLYALIGPEAEGVDNWTDAATRRRASWARPPSCPTPTLDITAPGTESGTYDAFVELALGDPSEARLEAGAITEDQVETIRTDYSSQADDNAIIAGIEGSDSSFGWVGFAFAEGAGDSIKEIEIDGGDGCVAPSIETIADGSYPLSRSLYIYVSAASAEENAAVAEFVDFYLTDESLGALVEEAGYVPLPDDRAATTQETLGRPHDGHRQPAADPALGRSGSVRSEPATVRALPPTAGRSVEWQPSRSQTSKGTRSAVRKETVVRAVLFVAAVAARSSSAPASSSPSSARRGASSSTSTRARSGVTTGRRGASSSRSRPCCRAPSS